MNQILIMLGLTVLQNASFTLVSRARNSNSIRFHTIASILSNGIYLLVIRHVVTNLDNWVIMLSYLVGSVIGSILMHHVSMNYFEKNKKLKSIDLIGCKIKGFYFENNGIHYNLDMYSYVGKIGKIKSFNALYYGYVVMFEDGISWTYPASEIEKHLIYKI